MRPGKGVFFIPIFKRCDVATRKEHDIMATAKKLPSGSWRCLVYSHTERTFDANQAHGRINEFMNHLPAMTHQDAGKRMLSVRLPNFNRIVTPMSAGNVKKTETFC